VTDDAAGARAQAAEQFAMYGRLPSYRAMLDREGFGGPEDAAIIGDEAVAAERLEDLRAAGVDEFVGVVLDRSAPAPARYCAGTTREVVDQLQKAASSSSITSLSRVSST